MVPGSLGTLLLLSLSSAAVGGVYTCQVDRKPVFSDRPCGEAAKEVTVKYIEADHEAAAAMSIRDEAWRSQRDEIDREIHEKRRDAAIRKQQRRISALQRERDAKLEIMRAKKLAANNNLAGATWEQSISTEMQVVAEQYGQKIGAAQADLQRLEAK